MGLAHREQARALRTVGLRGSRRGSYAISYVGSVLRSESAPYDEDKDKGIYFVEKFEAGNDSVELNIKISNMIAPGFLGFLLRNFGGKSIGKAFLNSYRKILEK